MLIIIVKLLATATKINKNNLRIIHKLMIICKENCI